MPEFSPGTITYLLTIGSSCMRFLSAGTYLDKMALLKTGLLAEKFIKNKTWCSDRSSNGLTG
jgi:hypothetical protein